MWVCIIIYHVNDTANILSPEQNLIRKKFNTRHIDIEQQNNAHF